jgi:16S rRNA G966 N2-methylase RsmD
MSQESKEAVFQARVRALEAEIEVLKKRKKYGLVWEASPEEVGLQCQETIPILKDVKSKGIVTDKSRPMNLLIEGDNYHVLSALNYTHQKKIDLIYIDPPYNTGANDWKYNNQYVDANDQWRHSKWLSFMEKRLQLAKRLLKTDGVLIVMIDEHEVHQLGMLLESIFPTAYRQMVTIVVNPKGVTQGRFSRVEEYAHFCFLGNATVKGIGDDLLTPEIDEEDEGNGTPRWKGLLRSGTNATRADRKRMFYPVLIDPERQAVLDVGEPVPFDQEPDFDTPIKGLTPVFPIRSDNSLGNWSVGAPTLKTLIDKGYVGVGAYDERRNTYGISYLSKKPQAQIVAGILEIVSYDERRNLVEVRYNDVAERQVKTVWHRTSHDAGAYGSDLLKNIMGKTGSFPFPKSLYAVRDCIAAVCRDRKDALILDFFAGSGTTGHAVLELTKEMGGNRRFILCTNNENNICEDVTYERMKRVIKGYKNTKGEKVEGLGGNLAYFKTDFVNVGKLSRVSDEAKIKVTFQVGEMIAIREDTLEEKEKGEWWQIFEGGGRRTAIYFKEDKSQLPALVTKLEKDSLPTALYVFSWGKNEYKSDYSTKTIRVEDIPEPILEVYKEINRL